MNVKSGIVYKDLVEVKYIPSSLVLLMQEANINCISIAGLNEIHYLAGRFFDGPSRQYILRRRGWYNVGQAYLHEGALGIDQMNPRSQSKHRRITPVRVYGY